MLVLSPTRRAIFQVFARLRKVPTQLQNISKITSKIHPKSIKRPSKNNKKLYQILDRFLPPKWSLTDPQMRGKQLGRFDFGPLGRPRAPLKTPKGNHGTPKASKMEPKGSPEPPQWNPKDPQSLQKGTQATPRAPKMEPKMPPGHPK